jgi:5-oxoprolinase (ATP-hydrolysing)
MINADVPLNQGCLAPIDIRVPSPSILSPTKTAAVVGGNVVTSQRITDVVLKAFQACAASQGCCNNLTFGTNPKLDPQTGAVITPGFGYYETIAGGSGAGPTWKGESGVHVHMTNTRITDPEILEKRYPTLLRQFTLREVWCATLNSSLRCKSRFCRSDAFTGLTVWKEANMPNRV